MHCRKIVLSTFASALLITIGVTQVSRADTSQVPTVHVLYITFNGQNDHVRFASTPSAASKDNPTDDDTAVTSVDVVKTTGTVTGVGCRDFHHVLVDVSGPQSTTTYKVVISSTKPHLYCQLTMLTGNSMKITNDADGQNVFWSHTGSVDEGHPVVFVL